MILTSHGYIHEYAIFDDICEHLVESSNEISSHLNNLDVIAHEIELRSVLEASGVDYDAVFEAEKEGVLAKIGNTIIALIEKIKGFLKSIGETIFGAKRDDESAEDKLNKILAANTGQDLAVIERDTDRDNFMGAAEAAEYGLVDRVIQSR